MTGSLFAKTLKGGGQIGKRLTTPHHDAIARELLLRVNGKTLLVGCLRKDDGFCGHIGPRHSLSSRNEIGFPSVTRVTPKGRSHMPDKPTRRARMEERPDIPPGRRPPPPPEPSVSPSEDKRHGASPVSHQESDHNKHNKDGQSGHEPQEHSRSEEKR